MNELTHLSLFSGIGGLDLAAEWAGFKTVGQCEWAEYPTKVLEKHWPDVPRWRDIRELSADEFIRRTGLHIGQLKIISGGFPCQPFSVAGKQRGTEDDRYLWPEMLRVIRELQPTWIIGENVPGIINLALDTVLSDLERENYACRTFVFPAHAVGARHRRDRICIVGYAEHDGLSSAKIGRLNFENARESPERTEQTEQFKGTGFGRSNGNVAYTYSAGFQKEGSEQQTTRIAGNGTQENNISNTDKQRLQRWTQTGNVESQRKNTDKQPAGYDKSFNVSNTNDGSGIKRWNREFPTASKIEGVRADNRGRTPEYEPGKWWGAKSSMGRVAYGLSDWMDRDRWLNGYLENEPDIPRVAKGVTNRVDKLKALGNAVVPQQFYPIFKAIYDIETGIKEQTNGH